MTIKEITDGIWNESAVVRSVDDVTALAIRI